LQSSASEQIHGSAFVFAGAGCLVLGRSGSGKTALVSSALLLGAQLIADDVVLLQRPLALDQPVLLAQEPQLRGVLALGSFGLVRVGGHQLAESAPLRLLVDLSADKPSDHLTNLCVLGQNIPLLSCAAAASVSVSALLLWLQACSGGMVLPPDWVISGGYASAPILR
jgi:serine kinase of HPr protein (carbohydrate metabolism regulator)